jgi:DNA polymerase III delta subunit
MWPFKSKKKEAEEIWRALSDSPPEDAMDKLIDAIASGNDAEAAEIFRQIISEKAHNHE